jgi:hypothetical protein
MSPRSGTRAPLASVLMADPDLGQLVVLAIAHTSKKPGYWRDRMKK